MLRLVCGAAHEGAMVEASDGQKSVAVARGGNFRQALETLVRDFQ